MFCPHLLLWFTEWSRVMVQLIFFHYSTSPVRVASNHLTWAPPGYGLRGGGDGPNIFGNWGTFWCSNLQNSICYSSKVASLFQKKFADLFSNVKLQYAILFLELFEFNKYRTLPPFQHKWLDHLIGCSCFKPYHIKLCWNIKNDK